MGDRPFTKKPVDYVKKLLSIVIEAPQELQDEVTLLLEIWLCQYLPSHLAAGHTFRSNESFTPLLFTKSASLSDLNTAKENSNHCVIEMYLQLMKQTTGNPDPDSALKGWKLIAVVCGFIPPSQNLVPYLSAYV